MWDAGDAGSHVTHRAHSPEARMAGLEGPAGGLRPAPPGLGEPEVQTLRAV